ncbi:unnamed protein product, partial [Lymnaea stagnalis]
LAVCGAVGNALSIKTFISIGLADWSVVSLAWLSASDLLYLSAVVVSSFSYDVFVAEAWYGYRTWYPVEPFGVYTIFDNLGGGPYALTLLVTTYLSLTRCLGVAMPLYFKHALTRAKTVAVLACFTAVALTSCLPILVFMSLEAQFDKRVNATRPLIRIDEGWLHTKDYVWGLRDIFLPLAAQAILVACVSVMAKCLRDSTRFRQGSMRVRHSDPVPGNLKSPNVISYSRFDEVPHGTPPPSQRAVRLSGRELQAVRQMLVISSVFIVSNTPKIFMNVAELSFTTFTLIGQFQALFQTVNSLRELFQTINSSVNFLIYVTYNTKFRENLLSLNHRK